MTDEIVKICKIHGPLTKKETRESFNRNGNITLRCSACRRAEALTVRSKDVGFLICVGCKQSLAIDEFSKANIKYKYPRCRPCASKMNHSLASRRQENRFFRKYGITYETYEKMSKNQGNLCAICNNPQIIKHIVRNENLCLDHCHKSGKIRGLLCASCNIGIGHFKDNPEYLIAAAEYLKKHS